MTASMNTSMRLCRLTIQADSATVLRGGAVCVICCCSWCADRSWAQIGPGGAWKGARTGAILGDHLYTAESDGHLYATDLRNGGRRPVGNPDFGTTAFLFVAGGNLYTLERDGSLYRVSPKNGTWMMVGRPGTWKDTRGGTIHRGRLYSVETSGALYATDLRTGAWTAVGKPVFGNTALLFAAGVNLFTIDRDGSLYRVNPANGGRTAVGQAGDWKDTLAGAVVEGRLCTAESNGGLFVTDLGKGTWNRIGKPEFGGTAFAFAAGGTLYTIEKDGTLYRVRVK